MEQLHNNLMERGGAYAKWHEHPKHPHTHWGLFIVVGVVLLLTIAGSIESWRNTVYDAITINFRPRSAMLALEPMAQEVAMGETFAVNIMLDTNGEPVDGVDIYSLRYDSSILSVVDDMTERQGVQITPGEAMDITVINSVDQNTGTINFSQATAGGTTFSGKGVLATVHFKAVGRGSTELLFDFKLGDTTDTNVAFGGRDQLKSVTNGNYIVK